MTAAKRFPDRLQKNKMIQADQWVFENGTRVYLWNGECCETIAGKA